MMQTISPGRHSHADDRLCHVCGDCFPKNSLPIHQKSCVRRNIKRLSPTRRSAMNLASTTIGADRIQPFRSINSLNSFTNTSSSSSTQLSSSTYSRSGSQTLARRSLSDVPTQPGSDRERERERERERDRDPDRGEYQDSHHHHHSSTSFSSGPPQQNAIHARTSDAAAEHSTTLSPRRVIRRTVKDGGAVTSSNRTGMGNGVRASNVGADAFDDDGGGGGRNNRRGSPDRGAGAARRSSRQPPQEPEEGKYDHWNEEDTRGNRNGFKSSSLRKLPNERAREETEEEEEEEEDVRRGDEGELPGPAGYSLDNLEDGIVDVDESDRIPCPNCGRKFAGEERLEKHVVACSKATSKRKVFDATKARVRGTELEQYVMRKGHGSEQPSKQKKQNAEKTPAKPKKAGWRVKHENFIKMVRSNRNADSGSNEPAPTYEPDPDLVQCQHCSRFFNESAAERHIPICANTRHKPKAKSAVGLQNAKDIVAGAPDEALRKRMSFKPPPPKTKAKK